MTYIAKTSNKKQIKESSLRLILQENWIKQKRKNAKPQPFILILEQADLKLLTGDQANMIDSLQKLADMVKQKIQD